MSAIPNVKDSMSLKGKTALITGGNHGLGYALSTAFAQAGADIGIMARDEASALSTIEELKAYGGTYRFYRGDVSREQDCARVATAFKADFGRYDILVNNAGITRHTHTIGMDMRDWHDVINTNLNGSFYMCYHAAPIMKEQGGGNIVNITSISAEIVNLPQFQVSYNTSKAALNHMTRSLALEWCPYNIRVNAIAPGYIHTDMSLPPDEGETKGWLKTWKQMTPQGHLCAPHEVGALAVFLASGAATYMTGSIVTIDGGYTLS